MIGDLANFASTKDGKPLPGVSPVAIQQGRHAARNILLMIEHAKPQRFYYWDKGQHGHDRPQPRRRRPERGALLADSPPGWPGFSFISFILLDSGTGSRSFSSGPGPMSRSTRARV